MIRAVLDTNVILAAYLTKGAASKIINHWAEGRFELLISEEIIREYLRILLSQQIDLNLVDEFSHQLGKCAKLIRPLKRLSIVKDDPDDNKFFECAIAGAAKII